MTPRHPGMRRKECFQRVLGMSGDSLREKHEPFSASCRGNAAISKDVLAAFRKLTKDTVVWDRSTKPWRKRNAYDQPDSHRQDS